MSSPKLPKISWYLQMGTMGIWRVANTFCNIGSTKAKHFRKYTFVYIDCYCLTLHKAQCQNSPQLVHVVGEWEAV